MTFFLWRVQVLLLGLVNAFVLLLPFKDNTIHPNWQELWSDSHKFLREPLEFAVLLRADLDLGLSR
jgi:hypothetical protein